MKVQFHVLLALVLLTGFSHHDAFADDQVRLRIGFWGPGDFSECDSTHGIVYFVGGTYDVMVTIIPADGRSLYPAYAGISDWTWPKGLEIEVGATSEKDEQYQPSAALGKALQFEYYVTKSQMYRDSLWKNLGINPPKLLSAPEYHFALHVPPELAGKYLWVNARWVHPSYGTLAPNGPIHIRIAPVCSETAQFAVWRISVFHANQQRQFERAVELADSFVALGWRDDIGLVSARNAATEIGRYDDAIRFLDLVFQTYHSIDGRGQGELFAVPPEEESLAAPTETAQRFYEQTRAHLLELKNQQQH